MAYAKRAAPWKEKEDVFAADAENWEQGVSESLTTAAAAGSLATKAQRVEA